MDAGASADRGPRGRPVDAGAGPAEMSEEGAGRGAGGRRGERFGSRLRFGGVRRLRTVERPVGNRQQRVDARAEQRRQAGEGGDVGVVEVVLPLADRLRGDVHPLGELLLRHPLRQPQP